MPCWIGSATAAERTEHAGATAPHAKRAMQADAAGEELHGRRPDDVGVPKQALSRKFPERPC